MEKKYTPVEAAQLLLKSLSEKIAKADPALQHILADIKDKDAKAEVPKEMVPENSAQNVLNKTGMQKPMEPQKAPEMPKIGEAPKNNVPANINQMSMKQDQPSQGKGMGMAKKPLKLSEFMQKKEAKRQEKGVHQADYSTTYIKNGKTQHGISRAGIKTREAANPSSFEEYEESPKIARSIHQQKLDELRSMPKPSLPKSEE